MHGKCEFFAELRRVSYNFVEDCLRNQFCAILEIQGLTLKFQFLYFSPFSVLSTVWLAEIAVFSKILRKKSIFNISEKRCLQEVKIWAWN